MTKGAKIFIGIIVLAAISVAVFFLVRHNQKKSLVEKIMAMANEPLDRNKLMAYDLQKLKDIASGKIK